MSPPSPSPVSLLQFFLPFFFSLPIVKLSAEEQHCNSSSVCKRSNVNISHPFWRIDGSDDRTCAYRNNFGVNCSNADPDYPLLTINGHDYLVRNISYPEHSITLLDSRLIPLEKDGCSPWGELQQSLDLGETAPFSYDSGIDLNITFSSNCAPPPPGGFPRFYSIGCDSYLFVGQIVPPGLDWIGNFTGKIETAVMKTEEMGSDKWEWNVSFRAAMEQGFVLDWNDPSNQTLDEEGGGGGSELDQFLKCNNTRYNCGEIRDVGYPFWGKDMPKECGHSSFHLKCDEVRKETTMVINSLSFRVFEITKYAMRIARTDLINHECPRNGTWPVGPDGAFSYFPDVENATLHFGRCHFSSNDTTPDYARRLAFGCNRAGGDVTNVTVSLPSSGSDAVECDDGAFVMSVLISKLGLFGELEKNDASTNVLDVLNQGITMWYNGSVENCLACEKTDGVCWSGTSLKEPTCLCPHGKYSYFCGYADQGLSPGLKIAIGIGVGVAFVAIAIGACWFTKNKTKTKPYASSYFMSRSTGSNPSSSSALDLEKAGDYHGVQRFDYRDLEEATENFHPKHELGDGGYGSVYKGKLRDGRVVAVKRLYENNYKRVEQFMNEIEILHRLSHKNLVRLYGCTSRHSRELLLVYEYIPNGTIADHLHGEGADPCRLPWATRLNIAVETASALAYLHASEVIHRDVKTNNILLDDGFRVKVADFGLSRLFPTHATHVSTAPQGTPGYLDPEYHECYQLTSKSDVYSFGVVLVELLSGLPAVDITRHRHEINLSNMAIAKIQCNALHEFVDKTLWFDSDERVRGMVCAVAEVAFQCLQGGKDMRPTMGEVLESLVEIQSLGALGKEEETVSSVMGSPLVDAPLLCSSKSVKNLPALSPNSVIPKWPSRSTTHSSSGC